MEIRSKKGVTRVSCQRLISRVNHNPSKTDVRPPNIYKMNVRGRIESFRKRPLDGLWLKVVRASRFKGRVCDPR